MKNQKYHTVGTAPNSNYKILERSKIDTHSTHIHDLSLFCLVKGISIQCVGLSFFYGPKPPS